MRVAWELLEIFPNEEAVTRLICSGVDMPPEDVVKLVHRAAGEMATEAVLAHVLVSKYADHLPLYRQSQIYAWEGVMLDRSTLADWVGRACWWLKPLHELVLSAVLSSPVVFADDTTLPVLEPGNGRTKTGRLWCYVVDDRPWKGPGHPTAHLAGFRGVLQTDGYAGFASLVGETGAEKLAFCLSHARRKFHDIHASTKAPLAGEALRWIADLYAVEAGIRGGTAEERRLARLDRSRPLVEALHAWLTETLGERSADPPLPRPCATR